MFGFPSIHLGLAYRDNPIEIPHTVLEHPLRVPPDAVEVFVMPSVGTFRVNIHLEPTKTSTCILNQEITHHSLHRFY
jgi:hypothetical protein